jgi:hypothetical protein
VNDFRLYGTALCQSVLVEIRKREQTVPDLVKIFGRELCDIQKRNLDRRIRRALETLHHEEYVEREWCMNEDRPIITYKIKQNAV